MHNKLNHLPLITVAISLLSSLHFNPNVTNGLAPSSIIIILVLQKSNKLKAVAVFFMVFLSSLSYGHNYFFAFAEVEYNDISKKFETTLICSTHDLQRALEIEGLDIPPIEEFAPESKAFDLLENYLMQHFSIVTNGVTAQLSMIGLESSLNGTSNFYFESDAIEIAEEVAFTYDLLMNHFDEQQNKITLYYRNQNYTVPFIKNEHTKQIKLENE